MVCTQLDKKRMKEYIVELLKFKNEKELLSLFEKWELPPFPVSAQLMKEKTGINGTYIFVRKLTEQLIH